jgi:hypothetical protein
VAEVDFDAFFRARFDGVVRALTVATGDRSAAEDATPESLPTSFVVALVGGADADAFADDLRALPSVYDVLDR